jgi:hypothetical protein
MSAAFAGDTFTDKEEITGAMVSYLKERAIEEIYTKIQTIL